MTTRFVSTITPCAFALMLVAASSAWGCGAKRTPPEDSTASGDDAKGADEGDDERGESPDELDGKVTDASSRRRDASMPDATARNAEGGAEPELDSGMPGPSSDPPADAGPPAPFEGEGEPWKAPAPRATCGAGDKADGTISGLSEELRCNIEPVAQVPAPHFLSLAWYRDCAYVNGADGTTVIRVAPDGTPTVTTTLTTVGFRSNWESMKANPESGLLAGYESNGTTLTVYDLKGDCAKPELQGSISLSGALGGTIGHAGNFSPDGTIYYASSMYTTEIIAVDLANPKMPTVITKTFERGAHDLFVAKGGTRGYFAVPDLLNKGLGVGSFSVMDLSQVQARAPNAKGTLISELSWEDGNISQYPILLSYRGKDFLMINDELGSGACGNPEKPQWGYARIFDLSDEKSPKLVSLIKTEAHEPTNCQAAGMAEGSTGGFGVGTHYCNVDRLEEPRLLSCGIQAGGVRVYDIRNPWRPKEVAYFSTTDGAVPGMQRIHVEKRELWLATQPGTFYVMKFPAGGLVDQILSN